MAAPKFQRRRENFTCKNCGQSVSGNGYTNHCPRCLWSMHVDVNPGDRAADCGGMMRPAGIDRKAGNYVVIHRCEQCGFERRNGVSEGDDFSAVIAIASRPQGGV